MVDVELGIIHTSGAVGVVWSIARQAAYVAVAYPHCAVTSAPVFPTTALPVGVPSGVVYTVIAVRCIRPMTRITDRIASPDVGIAGAAGVLWKAYAVVVVVESGMEVAVVAVTDFRSMAHRSEAVGMTQPDIHAAIITIPIFITYAGITLKMAMLDAGLAVARRWPRARPRADRVARRGEVIAGLSLPEHIADARIVGSLAM
jgi:hypothetical protein